MCLTYILSKNNHRATTTGYKWFRKRSKEQYPDQSEDLYQSPIYYQDTQYPMNKWIKNNSHMLIGTDGTLREYYNSGFHIYRDESEARASYFADAAISGGLILCKVQLKDYIIGQGDGENNQRFQYVAQKMNIIEECK